MRAAHAEIARVDNDAGEAGVPVDAELEDRQAGLRRNRHAHRIGNLEAVRGGELLLGEEEEGEFLELLALRQESERASRPSPERIVDAVSRQHAAPAPIRQPTHGPIKYPHGFGGPTSSAI